MNNLPEGNAVVYCEGSFNTPNGKTAHGLIRRTKRYDVVALVDSRFAGQDAGEVLDGKKKNLPIFENIETAIEKSRKVNTSDTFLVIGLAPDGGRLSTLAKSHIKRAITLGLNVDSGLHDFLCDDPDIKDLANRYGVQIRDVRKPPDIKDLHFFSGKIEEVKSLKIAVLGTDSAVGKRTTAWILTEALQAAGYSAELIGTGQTAWMQGVRYGIILDSLINDFVSGEIENAVWTAWKEQQPDVIIIEGQGSLMNPAYPGGFEILAAARPDIIVLQHAPARKDYDGFPGYRIHPLPQQIQVIEMLSGKPVVAITINHENIPDERISIVCEAISNLIGLPTLDVLKEGGEALVSIFTRYLQKH